MSNNADIELLAGLSAQSFDEIINDIKILQKRLETSGIKINIDADIEKIAQKLVKETSGSLQKSSVNIGKVLIESFGIVDKTAKEKIKSLANRLKEIRLSEGRTGVEDDNLTGVMKELSEVVINNANIIQQRMGIYDQFYAYLKKIGTIKISDAITADLGDDWDILRKTYAAKFSTTKGIELDSVYQELSTKFQDIFSGTANATDQFRELTDVIRKYREDVDKIEPLDSAAVGLEDSVFETIIAELNKFDAVIKSGNIKDSIFEIGEEADSMQGVSAAAEHAAVKKAEFAKANGKVKESADDTADAIQREYDEMNRLDNIDYILNNINMTGRSGHSIFEQLGDSFQNAFSAYSLANLFERALDKLIDSGKDAVETVKELNDATTSLRMATGDSYESVRKLINSYNDLGQELGAITTEVSESADEWLRQGHTVEDTNTLIKDSMILSKISNLDAADSTKYLTSAMQGYKVEVGNVIGIVDKLSSVDLESATDAAGLAEAMSRTAEGAQIAGISMNRLLGMISAVGEVTQRSMSSIGESYKTIFSRMRDIKDNKLSVIGEDGEIEDLSNVEIVLKSLGINLRESNQEFRNFEKVLDEVAASWDSYSSVQQAAIAKAFSGVRQQENFLVMMENYDKVIKYTNIAAASDGIAEEKFEYYLESLEAKTNSLIASLEELASTTVSEELYGDFLDISKGIVDTVTQTGILKDAIVGLGTAGSLYAIEHLVTFLREAARGFSNLSEATDMIRSGSVGINDTQRLIELTGNLTQSQTRLLLSTGNLTDAQKIAILMNQNMGQAEAEQTLRTWGLSEAQQAASVSTLTFSGVLRGLWATITANPLILITTGLTLAVKGIKAISEMAERSKEAMEEAVSAYEEAESELENLNSELTETNRKIDELNAKKNLSLVEQEELNKLKETNRELEAKIKLQEREAALAQKDAAVKAAKSYNSLHVTGVDNELADVYYREIIDEYTPTPYLNDRYNLTFMSASLKGYKHLLEEAVSGEDIAEIEEYSQQIENIETSLTEVLADFYEQKESMQDYYESLSGKDILTAADKNIMESYENLLTDIRNIEMLLNPAQYKENTISAIFDKVSFKGMDEELTALGKAGKLSVDMLSSDFPELIRCLDNAGVSAQELCDYIMALSEPDADNFVELRNQLQRTLGFGDGIPEFMDKRFRDLGLYEDGALEAYAEIRAKYVNGETEYWTTEDWISAILDEWKKGTEELSGGNISDIFSLKDSEDGLTNLGKISESIDTVQKAYKTLNDAIDEYNASGSISIDTLQSVIESGDDWLDYLVDEEGNLKLDKEALNELTESRLNDMRVQALNNVIDNVSAIADDTKANEYLTSTNYALAESYEEVAENALVSARAKMEDTVASGELSKANMDAVITKAESDIKKINKLFSSVNKDLSAGINSSKSSSKSSSDPLKDAFEEEYNLLKHNLEMEYITEEKYYNGVQALNEKYFAGKEDYVDEYRKYEEEVYKGLQSYYKDYIDRKMDYFEKALDANKISFVMYSNAVKGMLNSMWQSGKISAADYWSYVEKMLNKQKDIYDRVLSAVADILDDEIDAWDKKIDRLNDVNDKLKEQQDLYDKALSHALYLIEKEIEGYDDLIDKLDEADDKLNKQKDDYDSILSAVADVYDGKIDELNKQSDAIQEQIDLLNDENDALDLQYRKHKAIAELQKAREQRTKMVYSKDKGFHYVTDGDAVRDAEKELKDIETEELIASLNKEKEALAEAVEELEKYKDLWSEIADIYDKEMNKQLLIALYGENAEGLILANRTSDIENFKNNYIAVQKKLNSNDELRQSYEEKKKYYNELRDRWSELTDAMEHAENEQAAIQLWGADCAKTIMDARESDLAAFRDSYLAIQKEINSNEELIKSFEEKKEYYSQLKEQWNDVSSAYENAVNRQYAAQVLGANWEKDVLNGRMDVLTDFKNKYVSLQQEIANAAEASARAQANAANNLNTSSASSSSASSGSGTGNSSSSGSQKYKAYIGEEPIGVYKTRKEAEDAVAAVIEQRSSQSAKAVADKLTGTQRKNYGSVYNNTKTGVGSDLTKKVKIEKYHTGLANGLIGNGLDTDFRLIQELGLKPYEYPAILKEGEAVMTSEQISNLAESFRNSVFPPVNSIPDYGKIANAVRTPASFSVGDIHVTCPGITSNDVAKQIGSVLEKEFRGMSLYATQKMSITR